MAGFLHRGAKFLFHPDAVCFGAGSLGTKPQIAMTGSLRLALVINTFNQPEYLDRVLRAVARQTSLPLEVLVADDGSGEETKQIVAKWVAQSPVVRHVWQQKDGFRRARILNEAIALSGADYLVFLDGDTVPHPRFVADHQVLASHGSFVQGHRTLLRQRGSGAFGLGEFYSDRSRAFWKGQIEGWKSAYRWPRAWARQRADLRGIRGCNLGIWRADLVKVNGYNEAFVGWGREDSELAVRLLNSGAQRMDVRGWALCYHLWHPPASRAGLPANDQLLAEAQQKRAVRCELGLDSHLPVSRQ
jgi:glycosyltransferase involved in cell wall biosynthesis